MLVPIGLAAAAAACSMTNAVEGKGIGGRCTQNDECHAGVCEAERCTASCERSTDCPATTSCFAGRCMAPLNVSTFWLGGVSEGEGWNRTHQEGMQYAQEKLPYLKWTVHEHMYATPGPLKETIDRDIAQSGPSVVISNSFEQQRDVLERADAHPNTRFLIGAGTSTNGRNASSFFAHFEQAVYVAGKVAATKAKRRIGMIAALVTPEQVREVVAFTLGAKSVNPDIVVEVAWIGFWLDYLDAPSFEHRGDKLFREELLAARMVESGCEVIYHQSDTQRSVRFIDKLVAGGKAPGVWSIANNNRHGYRQLNAEGPLGPPIPSSLGAAYYNWGPVYMGLFERIHRDDWSAGVFIEPMTAGEDTPVGFQLSPLANVDDSVIRRYVTDTVARGPGGVFEGSYEINGQRDKDGDGKPDAVQALGPGERLTAREFDTMCWFPKGVVEKANPLDPSSADVEAHVPNPGFPPPPDLLAPPGAAPGKLLTCEENL